MKMLPTKNNFLKKSFSISSLQNAEKKNSPLVLTFNCGSSSVKFQAVDPQTGRSEISGMAERLNTREANIAIKRSEWDKKTRRIVAQVLLV